MIVPVNDRLREELTATYRFLLNLAKEKVNDRNHYKDVAEGLETLVLAALNCTGTQGLIYAQRKPGARMDLGAGTALARHVTESVAYLRDMASELISRDAFSQYESDHVNVALGYLKGLQGLILNSIIKAAEHDLDQLKDGDPHNLIRAAATLSANLSVQSKPQSGEGLAAKLISRVELA